MIVPKIHTNGTSQKELVSQISAVNSALSKAIDVLMKMSPNGRDYYHTENFHQACDQHAVWLKTIVTIQNEIMEVGEQIADQ